LIRDATAAKESKAADGTTTPARNRKSQSGKLLDAAGDAAVLNKSNPLLKKCLTAQQYVGMAALGS